MNAQDKEEITRILNSMSKSEVDSLFGRIIDGIDIPEEPQIPEGFKKYEGSGCPVPGGCKVEVILKTGNSRTGLASSFTWREDEAPVSTILYYKVTHAPALTREDFWESKDKNYWCVVDGKVIKAINTFHISDVNRFKNNNAFPSPEHAQTKLDWGL